MKMFMMCKDRSGIPGLTYEVNDDEHQVAMCSALRQALEKGTSVYMVNAKSDYRVFDLVIDGEDSCFILVEAIPLH